MKNQHISTIYWTRYRTSPLIQLIRFTQWNQTVNFWSHVYLLSVNKIIESSEWMLKRSYQKKHIQQILKCAMTLNSSEVKNKSCAERKNELNHFQRQTGIRKHLSNKQKLQTENDLVTEQEIAKRLHATVKMKHAVRSKWKVRLIFNFCADNSNGPSNEIRKLQCGDG